MIFGAFATDGRHVAVGEVAGVPDNVTVIDSETGKVRNRLSGHNAGVYALAFSPDGRTLATAGHDRSIKLWNWAEGKELSTLQDRVGIVKSLAFSRDGAWLAYAGSDNSMRIWDVARRRSLLVGHFPRATSDRGSEKITSDSLDLGMPVLNQGFSG